MNYTSYLQSQHYSSKSIERYEGRLKDYKAWCKKRRHDCEQIDYKVFLQYVKYLQNKGWKPSSVNDQLRCVKYYFEHLIDDNIRHDNPAEDVSVKRQKTKVLSNLLSKEELEDLYYSFETENINDFYFTATAKRNKVITGLIVYQALNNVTLKSLQVEHLQLYKGKIYIPSTRKSNSRTLELRPWQIIELMEYLGEYRPKIQKHIKNYSESLFPLNSDQFSCILNSVFKKLKTLNQKVKNIHQLRASVITLWLDKNNIREVQIMAGHKYIGSTEKYQQDNLENLKEAIQNYHPLA